MLGLRLLTFNVCRDGQGMGTLGWPKRRSRVLSFFRETRAHIIGLQEVTPQQLVDFDAALGEMGMTRAGARVDGDPRGQRNPIYFQSSRLKLQRTEVREIAGHSSRVEGTVIGRTSRLCIFEDTRTQRALTCANLHLDPGSGGWRELGAAEIHDDLEMRDAIVMGDFNADPESPLHRAFLKAGWQDSAHGQPASAYTFQNALTGKQRRIDWILLPKSWTVVTYAIQGEAAPDFSDHRPVLVMAKPTK